MGALNKRDSSIRQLVNDYFPSLVYKKYDDNNDKSRNNYTNNKNNKHDWDLVGNELMAKFTKCIQLLLLN